MNNQKQSLALDVPFLNLLGVQLLKMEDGKGEISLAIEEKHTNSWSVAHGGVLLALVDAAMAIAARSADPDDRNVVTIELKNSFMQAANGQVLVVDGGLHLPLYFLVVHTQKPIRPATPRMMNRTIM